MLATQTAQQQFSWSAAARQHNTPASLCSSSHDSSDGDATTLTTTSTDSPRRDMGMVFTCAKCDTRSVKAFSKHSYEKGLVSSRL